MLKFETEFEKLLLEYQQYRNENYNIVEKLNDLRTRIKYCKEFGKNSEKQIIDFLYEEKYRVDTAEILNISVYALDFKINEGED